jgi:hypothetical protein
MFGVQDMPPYHPSTDSTAGIRFVNLSAGSNSVSIDIQGNPNTPILSSLPYKDITNFELFAANTAAQINGYTFEFRDASSGNLLTTYTYAVSPFQNITICFIGSEDPTVGVPVSAIQENNF